MPSFRYGGWYNYSFINKIFFMNTIFFLKKRGKFTLLFILLSPLCLVSFYYENSEPPTECQQSLSYDMEEFRFYVIQDQSELQNLTELDKVKLKRTRLNRHFEICTDMAVIDPLVQGQSLDWLGLAGLKPKNRIKYQRLLLLLFSFFHF